MVEFVTLFLTMVWGPVTVEVAVDQRVAAVEIVLDGQVAGRIEGPPWRLEADLGDDLLPHSLEAVAFDAGGRRLGRAHQWVNLGRGLVEARWTVDPKERWPPKRARLVWDSISGKPPRGSKILFDEQPLEMADAGWVELPPYDPDETHSLSAALQFGNDLDTHADLVFGGVFGESVDAELSPAVVLLPQDLPPPAPEQASRWIRAGDGSPVRVIAVDSGPAFVVLVKDRRLPLVLPVTARQQMSPDTRRPRRLRRRDRIYFVQTTEDSSSHRPGVASFKPFEVGDPYRTRGALYAARRLGPPDDRDRPQHQLDALAVAGRVAAQSGRPRGVLWLRGSEQEQDPPEEDASRVDLVRVKRYLEALHVPLVIWQAGREETVAAAVEALQTSVARQAVLWIEGGHLPQEVTLSQTAPKGVQLAGGEP